MGQCMSRPPVKSDIPAPIPLENKDDVDIQQEQAKSTRSLGRLFSKDEVPNCAVAVVTEEVASTVSAAKTVETTFTQPDVDEGFAQACENKSHEVTETKEVDKPPQDEASKTLQDIEESKHDHVHYEEKGKMLNSEGILSTASCVENIVLPSRVYEIPDEKEVHSLVVNTIETKAIVLEEKLEAIGKETDDLKQQTYEEEERSGENIGDIKDGGLSGESIIENEEPCEVASLAKSGEGMSSEAIPSKAFPSEVAEAVIITTNQETEAALVSQDKEISHENSSDGECKDAEIKEIIAEKPVNEVEQTGEYESLVGVVQNTNGKCLEEEPVVEKQNTVAGNEGPNEVESAGKLMEDRNLMQDKSQNPGIITMKDETPLESTLPIVPVEDRYGNAEPTQIIAVTAESIPEESAGTREPLEGRVGKVTNVVSKEATPSNSLPEDTNSDSSGESAVTKEVFDEVREVGDTTTSIPVSDVRLPIGSELIKSDKNIIWDSQEKIEAKNEIDAEPVTATCLTGNAVGSEDIIADLASEEGILQKVANESNSTIETVYLPEDHYVEKGLEELNNQDRETPKAILDASILAAEKSEQDRQTDAVENDSKKGSDDGMQGALEAPLVLSATDGYVKVEDIGTIEQSRQDASASSEIKEDIEIQDPDDIEIQEAGAFEQSMQDASISSENKEIIINDEYPGAIEQCCQDTSISNESKEVILHDVEGDIKHNESVVKTNIPSSESTDTITLLKERVPVANMLPSESLEAVECTSGAAEDADMGHVNVGGQ